MNKNTVNIIFFLLRRYEGSSLFKGVPSARRIFLNTQSEQYAKVVNINESYKYFEELNSDLNKLEKKGLIALKKDFHDQVIEIILNVENVNLLYQEIGEINPNIAIKELIKKVENLHYENSVINSFLQEEISYIKSNYSYHKSLYENYDELVKILDAISMIYCLKKETKFRDFSISVFHDSKTFEDLKNKIIKIIKLYDKNLNLDSYEIDDDILKDFGLVKNSTYVLIKQNLVFKINQQVINLNELEFEYCLSDEMIEKMEILPSNFQNVITVENLTSFYDLKDDNSIIIYLGGFHNHTKRMLIEKIYASYPNVKYYHWSDIDVGGFKIFNHLINNTNIDFIPYKMSVNDLKESKILKPLTENDRKALLEMKNDPRYHLFKDEITYMLENNVKLEQESLHS